KNCTPCKREDFLVHGDYWMAVAALAAKRSKDPRTQVGACIVNQENVIVGIGYNRMPEGWDDDHLPWNRHGQGRWDTNSHVRTQTHKHTNTQTHKHTNPLK
uniref:dCMP deaminase n=1 Tax=Gadus morhua TaxID=8049 RepID=A0A8C5C0G8_GADMO